MKKQFAVFGLGSFGESIALELQKLGCEVVAVDKDMERVKGIADSVSYAMQADIGDPDFVRSLRHEESGWRCDRGSRKSGSKYYGNAGV